METGDFGAASLLVQQLAATEPELALESVIVQLSQAQACHAQDPVLTLTIVPLILHAQLVHIHFQVLTKDCKYNIIMWSNLLSKCPNCTTANAVYKNSRQLNGLLLTRLHFILKAVKYNGWRACYWYFQKLILISFRSTDGGYTQWTVFSPCTAKCLGETGDSVRRRFCTNPTPQFGGQNCTGLGVDKESKPCNGTIPRQTTDPTAECFNIFS